MNVLDKALRIGDGRKLKWLERVLVEVNALEPTVTALSDAELTAKTAEFRARLAAGETVDDLVPEAFAVVREAAHRVLGQRHYDVQVLGGLALHFGWVAQMRTGEGKTLVSTLPVYLNALSGAGVHVVTTNDYLAARDAEWMGRVHRFLGLSVGLATSSHATDRPARAEQYRCDITYATNNELGFDYLKDNLVLSLAEKVQRSHHFAIVDEIDSILIDEARTPLIISGRGDDDAALYYRFAELVESLVPGQDYEVHLERREIFATESGIAKAEAALAVANLYSETNLMLAYHFDAALRAQALMRKDKEYIVEAGEVKIVDEFTGRVLPGRRWSEGLHQAVEAKERVRIRERSHTLATVTLQNYFRSYDKLSGMTGTALSDAAELHATYQLHVVDIPTHRPVCRVDHPDAVFASEATKFKAIAAEVKRRQDRGQPVLIGTASVSRSELLSSYLVKLGIRHQVLNAKNHGREAEIVAQAGRLGAVTLATNMAGRGVDILLGGNPEGLAHAAARAAGLSADTEAYAAHVAAVLPALSEACRVEAATVRDLGGLFVLGSERHDARRIDDQLRGRAGRQGDPGETRFYLSLQDEIMEGFNSALMHWLFDQALPEGQPLELRRVTKAIARAQHNIETRNAEARARVLKYDDVTDRQRLAVYARRDEILAGVRLEEAINRGLAALSAELCTPPSSDEHTPEALDALHDALRALAGPHTPARDMLPADDHPALVACVERALHARYLAQRDAIGAEALRQVTQRVMLRLIDQHWTAHLDALTDLQSGVGLRAVANIDPVSEWQREASAMYELMGTRLVTEALRFLCTAQMVDVTDDAATPAATDLAGLAPTDPCPCASGRRVGACHGASRRPR